MIIYPCNTLHGRRCALQITGCICIIILAHWVERRFWRSERDHRLNLAESPIFFVVVRVAPNRLVFIKKVNNVRISSGIVRGVYGNKKPATMKTRALKCVQEEMEKKDAKLDFNGEFKTLALVILLYITYFEIKTNKL